MKFLILFYVSRNLIFVKDIFEVQTFNGDSDQGRFVWFKWEGVISSENLLNFSGCPPRVRMDGRQETNTKERAVGGFLNAV